MECEGGFGAQPQYITIAEQESPIAFANQHSIPVCSVAGKVFSVGEWRDVI